MDSMVLQLAKSLVQFDTAELNSVFTSVENPALVMLSKHLSIPELSNYIGNYTITFTSIAQSGIDGIIRLVVNRIAGLRVGSIVTIASSVEDSVYDKKYVVQAIDEESKTIDLNGEFTTTETGIIVDNSLDGILYANAYFILYLVAMSSQSIVKKDVIYSSQQFGQGMIAPASQGEKKALCDRYMAQAMAYIGSVQGMVI
jgi:hypothetical protein